tara:strand:- start:32 stop:703 length:672 start_codon:yes stop_codon:yes gene_type:complete
MNKNVVLIGDLGSKNRTGGGEIFFRNLIDLVYQFYPEKKIHCYTILHKTDDDALFSELEKKYSNLIITATKVSSNLIGHPFVDLNFYSSIKQKIRKTDADLIIHQQPSLLSILISGKQNIIFFHGPVGGVHGGINFSLFKFKSVLKKFIWQDFIIRLSLKLKIKFLREGYHLICNSEYTKKLLLETSKIPNQKMEVFGLPVNCSKFRPDNILRKTFREEYKIG